MNWVKKWSKLPATFQINGGINNGLESVMLVPNEYPWCISLLAVWNIVSLDLLLRKNLPDVFFFSNRGLVQLGVGIKWYYWCQMNIPGIFHCWLCKTKSVWTCWQKSSNLPVAYQMNRGMVQLEVGINWYQCQMNISGVFHCSLCATLQSSLNLLAEIIQFASFFLFRRMVWLGFGIKWHKYQLNIPCVFGVGCLKLCQFGPLGKDGQIFQLECLFGTKETWFQPLVGPFLHSFQQQLVNLTVFLLSLFSQ